MQGMGKVGDRIRQKRKERKLSMRELGRLSGLSTSAVSELEQGRSKSTPALHRIARALGTTPEWLEGEQVAELRGESYNDLDLMRSLIAEVDSALEIAKTKLAPGVKADLIVSLYRAYNESGERPSKAIILEFVRRAS